MNSLIKKKLGFKESDSDEDVQKDWDKRTGNTCKPCWELKYCPYGTLVEEFPVLPPLRKEAIEHNELLKKQISNGAYNEERTKIVSQQVKEFDSQRYPVKYSPSDLEKSCSVFGHMCPVFFVNEPFKEGEEKRRSGRYIPRHIMLRVVRRDNSQCQACSKSLIDIDIEFDHIIPLSKGGSTEEHNLRVTCYECNRSKSDDFEP
jgi:hypothetical protein